MSKYRFDIEGTAADGQTWTVSGEVGPYDKAGDFDKALDQAQIQTFNQLTNGKAIYGRPGVGCRGPYRFRRLLIEAVE